MKHSVFLIMIVLSLLVQCFIVADCLATPPCEPELSVVDSVILENLNDSAYIAGLEEKGFILTRFRGPADYCGEIPDNYVHLNFEYSVGGFPYSLTIQTHCDPSTLTCDFNPDDFFERIDYLESLDFISSRKESGYYKACEVSWLFGSNDRVRYHTDTGHGGDYLDMFLVDNKIVSANEYVGSSGLPIDRCADGSLPCENYIFGISIVTLLIILLVIGLCLFLFIIWFKRRKQKD